MTQTMLRRGDTAHYGPDPVTIVRAEFIRGERWLHVRLGNGGRLVVHPSRLTR